MYINVIPTVDDSTSRETTEINHNKGSSNGIKEYDHYEKVYFAFIDILGFKELYSHGKSNHFQENCAEVFNYYFSLINPIVNNKNNKTLCYAGQTSDSLYFYTDNIKALIDYIRCFSYLYLFAITKNIFFRGGLAYGDLSKNEDYQFYGDSVINAYLIESEISKNPIIVVDEKTAKELKKHSQSFYQKYIDEIKQRHYILPFACINDIDCLDPEMLISDNNKTEIDKTVILKNIKNRIKESEFHDKVFLKYQFLLEEYQKSTNQEKKNG